MRSPATICPPSCRAAVERDLAQRSSVTSTTPGMPGFSAKDANSRSCSLSMPPPTSMSRLRTDDMDSMASSSSTVTAPSVSRTSTTRSKMRILARSTSLARAAPIAASASWLGTTMIRYSTRSVLILSLPPRRFGSSVMNGSSVGSLWSILGQNRVGPHHPRACGSGVSYHRDPAETSLSARAWKGSRAALPGARMRVYPPRRRRSRQLALVRPGRAQKVEVSVPSLYGCSLLACRV